MNVNREMVTITTLIFITGKCSERVALVFAGRLNKHSLIENISFVITIALVTISQA